MKRFFAFVGDVYYPEQGMGDFIGDYDVMSDATSACEKLLCVGDGLSRFGSVWDSVTRTEAWRAQTK